MNLTLGEMTPLGKVSLQRPRRTPLPARSGRSCKALSQGCRRHDQSHRRNPWAVRGNAPDDRNSIMTIERCSPVHPGSSLASVTEDDSLGHESLTTLVFSMSPVGRQARSWQDYRQAGSASAQRPIRVECRHPGSALEGPGSVWGRHSPRPKEKRSGRACTMRRHGPGLQH
jgi:hypothetical protein